MADWPWAYVVTPCHAKPVNAAALVVGALQKYSKPPTFELAIKIHVHMVINRTFAERKKYSHGNMKKY